MEKKTEISILIPERLDQLPENLQHWIYNFAGYLGILLDRILPDQTRISIEKELLKIDDNKMVVLLLSHDFIAKNDLIKEIQKISDQDNKRMAASGIRIPRIFKVCILPLATEQQPEFLRDYIDYQVCPAGMKIEDISFATGMKSTIWSVLVDLAYDISGSVMNMMDIKLGKQKGHRGPTIYLAETNPGQKENRDALRRELIQFGYHVVPYKPLSGDATKIEKSINDLLHEASFAIHIVGNEYGDPLPGSKYSLVELQLRLSSTVEDSSVQKGNFQRVIWFPPDLKPSDVKQQLFIENLIRQEETMQIAEIVQTPLELLKSIVRRRISKKDEESEKMGKVSLPEKPFIYLIHEKKYEKEIEPVLSWFRKQKIDIIWTGMVTSAENLVQLHRHYLANCSGVLIHYSGDNVPWISSKLKDLLKAPGFGRKHPIKAMAVMVQNGDKFAPPISGLDIISIPKGTKAVNFDNFLEKINQ